jgi:preprotein translocase subunit SecE
MKSLNRTKLRTYLLTVLVCFTVYLSLALVLFDFNLRHPLAC